MNEQPRTLTILLDPNAEPERKLARPVEEVAKALLAVELLHDPMALAGETDDPNRNYRLAAARATITRLRQLGFINDIGLQAIKAEEKLGVTVKENGK